MTESTYCVFRYVCSSCGQDYFDLAKGDHAYGELTARSTGTGQLVYVSALTDPVFGEVERLAEETLAGTGLQPTGQRWSAAVQRAYTVACDPCEDGTPFLIGGHPACPACKARQPVAWEHTGEHQIRDVSEPTHKRWLALTPKQRRRLIRSEIADSLSG